MSRSCLPVFLERITVQNLQNQTLFLHCFFRRATSGGRHGHWQKWSNTPTPSEKNKGQMAAAPVTNVKILALNATKRGRAGLIRQGKGQNLCPRAAGLIILLLGAAHPEGWVCLVFFFVFFNFKGSAGSTRISSLLHNTWRNKYDGFFFMQPRTAVTSFPLQKKKNIQRDVPSGDIHSAISIEAPLGSESLRARRASCLCWEFF